MVEDVLDHADWSALDERAAEHLLGLRGAALDTAQLNGRLHELLILAAAGAPQNAPLALQLESVQCSLSTAASEVARTDTQRASRRLRQSGWCRLTRRR